MIPLRAFKGHDVVFTAPPAWDQSDTPCDSLAIKRTEVNGLPALTSYFRPTEDELTTLLAGGCIQLTIVGTGLPPVMVEAAHVEEA